MAPPGVISFYENLDKDNYSPSSLLLSPFPSFTTCKSPSSVYSEHNYFFKNIDGNMKETTPEMFAIENCFDCDILSSDKREVTTPYEETGVSMACPSSQKHEDDDDNVFNDVTLVSRLETPVSSCDTDFLQGLDELDFDLDDCEPSRAVSLENFLDATLEDTMDLSVSDSSTSACSTPGDDVEDWGEDVYRKEFFLKHLRLQRVSPQPTSPPKNRKRKHEESESTFSELPDHTSSRLSQRLPESVPSGLDLPVNSVPNEHNTQSTHYSSPLRANTLFTPLSVPSKLCSCASSDWKRTILYSTAKSSAVVSVQTSPSTASVSGLSSYRGSTGLPPQCRSYSSNIADNEDACLSPSLLLSEKAKDRFEFDLLDKNEMDEDTKDLLRWLDSQDIQTTISGMTASCPQNSSNTVGRLTSESYSSCSSSNYDVMNTDDLEVILSPGRQHSSLELDTFQNLEAFVSDEPSSPVKEDPGKIRDASDIDAVPNSQIQKMSILADISTDILNSEYKEKKDAIIRDILKSCQSSYVSYSPDNHQSWKRSSPEYWSDDSPFSSSSSLQSSPSSSPPHSPTDLSQTSSLSNRDFVNNSQPKNLDLLNLFADENALWCL